MLKFVVMIVLSAAVTVSSSAQAVATVPNSNVLQSSSVQRITVAFNNTPLDEAVRTIAKRSGNPVIFAPSLLPNKRVTYKGVDVTPATALAAVLDGTALRVSRADDGAFELIRAVKGAAQGVITGRVTDAKTGKGITGATVSLDSDTRGAMTGEDGSYRTTGVATGSHIVSVRLVGYAKQSRFVTVGEGAAVTVDFKLEPSANVLDQVVVTGTVIATELKAVPSAITVITAKQIEERGITRIDQLFRGDIPGLFAINQGTQTLSLLLDEVSMFSRGATGLSPLSVGNTSPGQPLTNPIKTYIDGVEMTESKYLSQIDPSSIERIEILTGPQASTIYGSNAINGVMQIFTKRGSTNRPQLTMELNSGVAENAVGKGLAPSHNVNAQASGVEGRLSYNVGGSWNYAGAWTASKQTQRLTGNGGIRMELAKLTLNATARQGLTKNRKRGSELEAQTELRSNGVWAPIQNAGLSVPTTASVAGQTWGLTLNYRPFALWSHEMNVGTDASTYQNLSNAQGFLGTSDTLVRLNSTDTKRTSERYTTMLQLPISTLARLSLTLGADHWRAQKFVWSANSLTLSGSLSNPSVTRSAPDKNSGGFMQGQLSLRDALFFTYGLRAEWNPNYGDEAQPNLAPRYGVSYTHDLGPVSAKFRASYGRSTRPPSNRAKESSLVVNSSFIATFGSYTSRLGNPDLGPEFQQGGEGGIELYMGNRGSFVLTRYNQTVDNLIGAVSAVDSVRSLTNTPSSSVCVSAYRDPDGYCYAYQSQNLNVASIRNQGWELQGSVNTGPFTTRGTYSWTKSRVIGVTPQYRPFLSGSQFEPGRPFDFLPEHTWALGVSYAKMSNTMSLTLNGIGMLYRSSDNIGLAVSSNSRSTYTRPRTALPENYRSPKAGYVTSDLNVMHRFTKGMDGVLQVLNLTNYTQNDYSSESSAIGRQSKLGVRIRM